ncbi:hypothetical protein AFLA70_21g004162 [Aspergillus flavus AF70]|nr:hypothetical protein AFLA70_21g004162 [Aspergillus flavus AF70]
MRGVWFFFRYKSVWRWPIDAIVHDVASRFLSYLSLILPNVEFPSASVLTVEYPQAAMDHMTGNRDQITFKLAMMTLALLDSPYNM